jgi:hypothetical protein
VLRSALFARPAGAVQGDSSATRHEFEVAAHSIS